MRTKESTSRSQIQFSSLDDQIASDNPVRIIDAFVEKLDWQKLAIKRKSKKQRSNSGGASRKRYIN